MLSLKRAAPPPRLQPDSALASMGRERPNTPWPPECGFVASSFQHHPVPATVTTCPSPQDFVWWSVYGDWRTDAWAGILRKPWFAQVPRLPSRPTRWTPTEHVVLQFGTALAAGAACSISLHVPMPGGLVGGRQGVSTRRWACAPHFVGARPPPLTGYTASHSVAPVASSVETGGRARTCLLRTHL